MKHLSILCLVSCLLVSFILYSQIPQTLSYQGVLKDAAGVNVPNGDYQLTFNLYPVQTERLAIWTEVQTITVTDGIFNVILGSVNPLNVAFDAPYWLGVTVGTGSELPLIPLTSSAYSLNAKTVMDTSISTAKLVDGAVTQEKLAPGLNLPPGGAAGGDLTGTYPNPEIAGNAVTSGKIQDGTIQMIDLAFTPLARPLSPGVVTEEISDNAVTTPKIADQSITQAKLSPGLSLPPGGTAGGDLTGSYPNPSIATGAVTTGKLADNSVSGTKIVDGTIVSVDLGDDAVISTKILDGGVRVADLASNAVSTVKIEDGAVTQAKIASGVTLPPSGTASGDLNGSYPSPTVDGLQGRMVSSSAPAVGQVLKYTGFAWAPGTDVSGGTPSGAAGGDLSGTYPDPTIAAGVVNTNKLADNSVISIKIVDGTVVSGDLANSAVTTVKIADGAVTQAKLAPEVTLPPSGTAGGDLSGTFPNPTVDGLQGRSVSATAPTTDQILKWDGSSWSPASDGMSLPFSGQTSSGTNAFYLQHTSTNGTTITGRFDNASTTGTAVRGISTASSGDTRGGSFQSSSTGGTAVYGFSSATSGTTYGGRFENWSSSGTGVYGLATSSSGATYGVYGQTSSTTGQGVYGEASTVSGINYGVYGLSASNEGTGVYGYASSTSATSYGYGVWGLSESAAGRGVYGIATGSTGINYGGYFRSNSTDGFGIFAMSYDTGGDNFGVYGMTFSPEGYGVYSNGRFAATGTKSFQIDHPFNPENKYLNHYCTEGAEPLNVYSGNVILDERGESRVELPHYFEAINRDFRYQLTCIGKFSPVYIAEEIKNNSFKIAGGQAGMKVSWRVEAVRNDRWVVQYGAPVEQDKPEGHRGKYLNPELFGRPETMGIFYENHQPSTEENKIK